MWLQPNPRRRWVDDIEARQAEIGRALKAPLRNMLGCGHWGCVFDSTGPWVVKITIDPNEAPVWERIVNLIEEECYGQGGIVRVRGIYRIEPGVEYGRRTRPTYAIVREAAEPVFYQRSNEFFLTDTTKRKLRSGFGKREVRLHYSYPAFGRRAEFHLTVDGVRADSGRIKEFTDTVKSLAAYQNAVSRGDHGRAERIAGSTFYGAFGGAIGETLTMLGSNRLFLRDVHLFNIGWRKHSEIAGFGYEAKTLVIFDPGHTPVGKSYTIPTVRYANPWGYGS